MLWTHTGESFFLIAGGCNTEWMNVFLEELSQAYPDDYLLFVMDNAIWHKSSTLKIPTNIGFAFIPPEFVKQDEQAFTRKRRLSLETMIRTILGMGGKSLSKELLDARLTVSNSAFVQRRYQIKPEAFYALFKEFTAPIPLNTDFPIFAADGSDICIPRNPMDTETSIQTQTDVKSYNLIHINALYDLTTGVYRDVSIQDKHAQHERLALIQMMEASPFRESSCYHG
ncbi:putative transposase [Streptococcus pneumoniae]|nr:putative transposase [Streptococcus pneumoniae]